MGKLTVPPFGHVAAVAHLLVTIYLAFVGLSTEFVGVLLWPAAAIHAALTALLTYPLIETR